MKAVDPALAHAQSGDASFVPRTTTDRPLTDEEDFEGDEADCGITGGGQRRGLNGRSESDSIMGNIKNAKDLKVDGKSELSWPRDRVINGQTVTLNGISQHSNGVVVNGNSKINGGLESVERVMENGHENSKVNGGLESVEKVVENGHEHSKMNGGLESNEKVVENGHGRRVQVNGNSNLNGGLEPVKKAVENGHITRALVNGNSNLNGGLEPVKKVVENGHSTRALVNGNSKVNGGLEPVEKVPENGHSTRVQVNGNSKVNGGLEPVEKVAENGHSTRVQVNGNSKVNGGLEPVEKVAENGHENPKVNGGLESNGKVVENGHDRRVQVNGNSKVNGEGLECGDKVLENGHDRRVQVNGNSKPNGGGFGDKVVEGGDRTVAEMKEHAFARLQDELKKAHQELKLRDEEVTRLSRIRQDVEAELEDLTASLFQEAHNMVREANVKQAAAERAHKESQMQVDVLVAEVSALKTLVLTSTPSRPNPHLHPQIDLRGNRTKDDSSLGATSLFNKKHRRSPSHFNLKYGRENSPPDSPVKEAQPLPIDPLNCKEGWEVDPDVHREFTAWKLSPKLDKSDPFISRIYNEEINLCLDFPNKELSTHVRTAVESGNIFIEAVSDKTKTVFPKKCALLDVPRQCHYRMKFGDQEQWYCMSQICRNRIIAVCDFLNYLKYIERGLVKSSAHDVYWEVTRLRKDMVLARLGLALLS